MWICAAKWLFGFVNQAIGLLDIFLYWLQTAITELTVTVMVACVLANSCTFTFVVHIAKRYKNNQLLALVWSQWARFLLYIVSNFVCRLMQVIMAIFDEHSWGEVSAEAELNTFSTVYIYITIQISEHVYSKSESVHRLESWKSCEAIPRLTQ